MTEQERAVIVGLIDDCKARGVRHFRKGELEFEFERPAPKRPEKIPALSRLRGEAA